VHPVDRALGSIATAYNSYVRSGDLTGTAATSYSSLVPFAEATGTFSTLASHANNNGSYLNGPSTSDQVTCFSCHRAHASGFDFMLRFNMGNEFMVNNGSYVGTVAVAQGRTDVEMTAAYYDRPASQFASYQRVLCNKCHAKD
jgi:predicted CXXCH cytochrome family protein